MYARSLGTLAALWLIAGPVAAEVTTDGSLGHGVSLSGPTYQITADLGQQSGSNLFHSFSRFNLSAAEAAVFSGPAEIRHLIGRITDGTPSKIQGSLSATIPGSQLWLFNPSGITQYGPVDIPGGVKVAQASSLSLKDGSLFSADLRTNSSQLSVAAPQAFILQTTALSEAERGAMQPPPPHPQPREEKPHPPAGLVAIERNRDLLGRTLSCQAGGVSQLNIHRHRGSPFSLENWQTSRLLPPTVLPPPSQDQPLSLQAHLHCHAQGCNTRYAQADTP